MKDKGKLQPIACHVVARCLYGVRNARREMLRAVNRLSAYIHFWDVRCDVMLKRVMDYLASHLMHMTISWVGQPLKDNTFATGFADADLGGCERTLRSTSGNSGRICGPKTNMIISDTSQRQSCCADSTPFAEMTSGNNLMKSFLIPIMDVMDVWQGKGRHRTFFCEDNQPFIQCIKTGRNLTMKHWPRTTGLSFQSMHENMGAFNRIMPIDVMYTETKSMVADIHTKHFANPEQWNHARRLCGVFESYEELDTQIQTHFEWFSSLLTTYEESKVNKYGRVKSEEEESGQVLLPPRESSMERSVTIR